MTSKKRQPTASEWTKLGASLAYVVWFVATFWPEKRKELAVLRGLQTGFALGGRFSGEGFGRGGIPFVRSGAKH